MKYTVVTLAVLMSATSALACSYAPIQARPGLTAAQRSELADDQRTLNQLRQDMNTVCTTRTPAAINSCMVNKGPCENLRGDLDGKFQYDFGADGSLKGMVSPEDRTKNAEIINNIYAKWRS